MIMLYEQTVISGMFNSSVKNRLRSILKRCDTKFGSVCHCLRELSTRHSLVTVIGADANVSV